MCVEEGMSDATDASPGFEETSKLRTRIEDALVALCERGEIDWKGHFDNGKYFEDALVMESLEGRIREGVLFGRLSLESFLKKFASAIDEGKLLDKPLPLGSSGDDACSTCGERARLGFDGQRLVVLADPCPYPEGIVTEWELNVPSGKLVFANDLREWFPSDEEYSVNPMIGRHQTTLAYAKVGMAHGFVSNTSPSVYRSGERFVVGGYQEELWDDEEHRSYANPDPCPWGDVVASISTELWWYSIVDFDEFARRVSHYTPKTKLKKLLRHVNVVDVKPGVYRFRQDQGVDHEDSLVEHASFEWVREPDEPRNYIAEDAAKHCSAIECLIEKCLSWPTLYLSMSQESRERAVVRWQEMDRAQKTTALARAADQAMCTLGGGTEWHENGFPRGVVSDEARRLAAEFEDVPAFDFETHWYPISAGYGGLSLGAGVRDEYTARNELISLAPSFVRLGLNICQNAIKFGSKPQLSTAVWPPAFEVQQARDGMRLFARCYRGLRARYPDEVFDVEFDHLMATRDFDRYVADFDFGPDHPPEDEWGRPPLTIKTGAFFEFDSKKLKEGRFCWHPKEMGAAWARKEDAQRYRLGILAGTDSPLGHLHTKGEAAAESVPLRVVGRVVRGTGDETRSKHLEVAFDYGTEEMRTERWVLAEGEMSAVRQFDDEVEYAGLLEQCKIAFVDEERAFEVRSQ